MKMADIRKKAQKLGVTGNIVGMKKADLIKAIQRAEGNPDCFGTATTYCDQARCSWREECLPEKS
jgi:hypothetical protein